MDHKFSSGWTGLMYASNSCNKEVVSLLLDNGADVNYACGKSTVITRLPIRILIILQFKKGIQLWYSSIVRLILLISKQMFVVFL